MSGTFSLVLAGLAVAVLAAPAAGQVPTRDSVTGSGTVVNVDFALSVEAGPSGEDPTGSLHSMTVGGTVPSEFDFDATPTCLAVSGTLATAGFRITSGQQMGGGFLVAFADGGTSEGADEVLWFQFIATGPTNCPSPRLPPPPGAFPAQAFIQSGGVTIVDAPPFPTSKDQCEHGGWRSYGVFKNQGDCVSFVATGGKNPPAKSP